MHPKHPAQTPGTAHSAATPKHILVVDDEAPIRTFLRTLLQRRCGFPVVVEDAEDAETALRMLQARPYNLVITDLSMGAMSGIDLLERVHRSFPRTGRVLITGSPSDGVAAEAVERGAVDGFMGKPFNATHLVTLVQSIVDPRLLVSSPASAPAAPPARVAPVATARAHVSPTTRVPTSPAPVAGDPESVEAARREIAQLDHAIRKVRVMFGVGRLSAEAYRAQASVLAERKSRIEVQLLRISE